MKIALACDHGGFRLKEVIKAYLEELGIEYVDYGAYSEESVDYPDFARKAAKGIVNGEADRGIFVCGTGIGISIAANKVKGIRAALCYNIFAAEMSRRHNDANVLCLGGRVLGVTSLGDGIEDAIKNVYQAVEKTKFDHCFFRRDIGAKALKYVMKDSSVESRI